MNELLSVIIPVYNAQKYISECIRKLSRQTYQNIEAILVDDGSTDESGSLCDEMERKYDFVRSFHQKNSGPGIARKTGFENSSGKYITFLDVDDYLVEQAYEQLIEVLEHSRTDIVEFGYYKVDEDGSFIFDGTLQAFECNGAKNCYHHFIAQKNCTNFLWNKVFLNTLFHNVEWKKFYYSEDYCVLAQLYAQANHIITVDKTYYYYVQSRTNACNLPFNPRKLDTIRAGEYVVEFTQNHYPDLLGDALFYVVTRSARLAYDVYLSEEGKTERDGIFRNLSDIFREYYREMMLYSKKSGTSIPMDRFSRMFRISPVLACVLFKLRLRR